MNTARPLIITLQLNQEAQDYFNQLRKLYFPPSINYIDAHLTLFHQLPPDEPTIIKELKIVSNVQVMQLEVTDVRSIGEGVAYFVENKGLELLHQHLQQKFLPWLTPQDKQPLKPHITIQNKVPAAAAHQLQQQLKADFKPFFIEGIGLNVWEYEEGPWKHLYFVPFVNEA